jgi:general secretion pathway protein B
LQAKSAATARPAGEVAGPHPTPPAAAPERVPALAELPESTRRELPALRFGGAMDSPQPAARMLIINGQVFREGDALAPGLTLQTIRLRSAIFEFRGQRFEAAY